MSSSTVYIYDAFEFEMMTMPSTEIRILFPWFEIRIPTCDAQVGFWKGEMVQPGFLDLQFFKTAPQSHAPAI